MTNKRSDLDFLVVGIGASAGGISAIRRLLEHLPAEPNMAFVVVLHLSPRHESSMAEILQLVTRMPVHQVQGTTAIERNTVYVIPPTQDLAMIDSHLVLSEPAARSRGRPVVIDSFFRTLAEAHRARAVGIVLSGTGSDGSTGIGWLKQFGGVVIAQSPSDAEYDGMPAAAIATGYVDIVMPIDDMAQRLLELWTNAQNIEVPRAQAYGIQAKEPALPEVAEGALRDVMQILRQRSGHDFRRYKRATLLRRIERRLQVNGVPTLPAYREFLSAHPEETRGLLGDLLIGVTQFFRDRSAFEALDRDVVPAIFTESRDREQIRAWIAASSSGEEAYSLSILLAEEAKRTFAAKKLTLFATDIDERAIEIAREGYYSEAIVADLAPAHLRQYFTKESGGYRIAKAQRDMVVFALHNVLRDPPFSRLDLVSCRNLLIYLDRAAQHDVLQMFHFALRPGGFLFLGNSETVDAAGDLFTVVDKAHRIFRANPTARNLRGLPNFAYGGPALEAPAAATAKPRALKLAELHERLLGDIGPASVVVTTHYEIVHSSRRASDHLRFIEGTPSTDIIAAVRPELRQALRVCLYEVIQTRGRAESPTLPLVRDGKHIFVRLSARFASDVGGVGDLILLIFDELSEMPVAPPGALDADKDPALAQLEAELLKRTEQLQTTVEQYETSAEELKASNEELQAINEELRAATEELETSKEELQSTNEELITVNAELKTKVEETTTINDDLSNLIAVTEIATIFVDEHMRIKRFTPAAATVFSLLGSDVGRALFDITHRLKYPTLAADAQGVFTTLKGVEHEVQAHDGRWFLARLLPYRTSGNNISGVVLTFVDVSNQHAEKGLRRSGDEAMRLVADTMTDYAIVTLDSHGKITGFSAGAEALLGWSAAEVVGSPFHVLFLPEDRAADVPAIELRTALDHGRAQEARYHLHKDGRRVYLSGILQPFSHGGLGGFVKIARAAGSDGDDAMKGEFLAVLSHELKHPLNLINVNAELLTKLPEARSNDRLMRAAQTIQRTVKSQARVIDDLLDLSRTETGKLVLNVAPMLLSDAIGPAVQSAHGEARAKGIDFRTEGLDLPLLIDGEPVRIEQIAWNLLSNALKFSRRGGSIVVGLSEADGFATFEVRDTGRGIAPDFLPRVFDLFWQDESATRRQEGGLGIGLALVKNLAELHGGSVSVASDGAGRGATFRVTLPLRDRTGDVPPAAATTGTRDLAGLRILLVDDTLEILETFAELLADDGADVTPVSSGREALAACDAHDFDLIVSDIGMPLMDGYELIAELRSRPKTARVPSIALTGFGRPQDVKRALSVGFDAHLDKPVDFAQMRTVFDRLQLKRR